MHEETGSSGNAVLSLNKANILVEKDMLYEHVLDLVVMDRVLLVMIRRGQLSFIGHVVKRGSVCYMVEISGRGNRRILHLKYLESGICYSMSCRGHFTGWSPCWFQIHSSQHQTLTRHLERRRFPCACRSH